MKAIRRPEIATYTRYDLINAAEQLKYRSATEIFQRLGVKYYVRCGSTFKTPGIAAIQGLPKKAPLRLINEDHWYSAEELLSIWLEWATNYELEKIVR